MQAVVVHARNPFAPGRDRAIAALHRPVKVSNAAHRLRVDLSRPTICLVNGAPLLRAQWRRRRIRHGDLVAFVTLPQGGGDGSNPLAMVLQIALMAFAGPIAEAIYGGIAGAGAGAWLTEFGFQVLKGAVSLIGSTLINAMLPTPRPPSPQIAQSMAAPSPTYNLQAQGNQARLGQAIPEIFGRHLVFPDFAAQPYAEYAGNEQYLYQLFCVGQGYYDIEALRIEDSPISSFAEIDYEVVQPGGTVTLFPTDVVTSGEVGGQEAEYNVALGPFTVNGSGTQVNAIAIDIVCPKGLYYANDQGGLDGKSINWNVEMREIDDDGLPIGAWGPLGTGSEMIQAATNTPQRRSYRYNVAPGRYEVRLTRTSAKDASARAGHDLNWVGLRGYIPGSQQYGNVTMLAMRMRATNSLSQQASRKVNLILTRKLRAWNPTTGWGAYTATRSIAWAAAYACGAANGGELPDSRTDLAQLLALDATWAARSDNFDMVFDSTQDFWEALKIILRAGRAQPFMQGGVVRFWRDQQQTLPTTFFSMRNIVRGSFRRRWIMPGEETADSVEVEFFNGITWLWDRVLAKLPDSAGVKPAKVRLSGVTNRAQAWREGMYMAACNRYRRKPGTFNAEMEGMIPTVGDLIACSHDMLQCRASGEILSFTGGNGNGIDAGGVLELSEPVTFGSGAHYIAFSMPDASVSGPWRVVAGADGNHVVLDEAVPNFQPYVGDDRERTRFAFGPGSAIYQRVRVLPPLRPLGGVQVEVNYINDDDRVHTADGGTPPDPPPAWQLPAIPDVPEIPGEINAVAGGTAENPSLSASWPAAPGAEYYLVEHSFDNQAWTRIAEPTAPEHSFTTSPGPQYLHVAPVGVGRGGWKLWNGDVQGANYVSQQQIPQPANVVAAASQTTISLTWDAPGVAGIKYVEVFRNTVNDSGTATLLASLRGDMRSYFDTLGVSNATRWYWVRFVNVREAAGPLSVAASATTGSVGGVEILNSLPATGNYEGRVVYLTTDDTIWRYDGSEWTAAVDGADILANSITAQKLSVANLAAISANLGAITAGSININDRFVVAADGSVTIKSSATGARVETTNSVIKVFDSAGVLRVKLGDLSA